MKANKSLENNLKKQNKNFIITIDTEGDNLWEWKEGTDIETHNTRFLPRFQELCDRYGFIPTWLVNYEMAMDDSFVEFAKNNLLKEHCEIGMHLHAWNTPPYYELPRDDTSGKPFLIEYPDEVMEEKIVTMTSLIEERFKHRPVVHRAGRWGTDDRYFKLLRKHGYIADCSVSPHISWGRTRGRTPGVYGNNYKNESDDIGIKQGILEVPVTTLWSHRMFIKDKKTKEARRKELKHLRKGRTIWLRPTGRNLREMLYLIDKRSKSNIDFIEFMIHSSELMPGGSPNFKTDESVNNLYEHLEIIFRKIARNYEGIGLESYAKRKYDMG